MLQQTETVIFGGGCFWCTEAVFSELEGVVSVVSGYSGGTKPNPTYEDVCTGHTGHVEAIKIEYDPQKISCEDLLAVFFYTHDPTQLNRQGNDVGTQYRSVIFYTNDEQRRKAEELIKELNERHAYKNPVVTRIEPLRAFYEAEEYHKRYYERNKEAPYCQVVIVPKLKKLREKYALLLKKNA